MASVASGDEAAGFLTPTPPKKLRDVKDCRIGLTGNGVKADEPVKVMRDTATVV